MKQEIKDWIADGNAVQVGPDIWIEQTTQWKKRFTTKELIEFFNKEFRS